MFARLGLPIAFQPGSHDSARVFAPPQPAAAPNMQALAAPTLALRLGRPFCPVPPSQRFTRQQCATLRRRQLSAAAASSGTSSPPATASAKESVERGLEIFAAGDAEAALALFQRAQGQAPTPDEARAACYNAACAHTRLRQWQAAVDQLTRAINEYDLKLSVALKDPDLEPLRERREWLAGLAIMRGASACGGGASLPHARWNAMPRMQHITCDVAL